MQWWQIDILGEDPEILEGILALHGAEGTLRITPRSVRGFFQVSESHIKEILNNLQAHSPILDRIEKSNWVTRCEELLIPLKVGNLTITPVASYSSNIKKKEDEILIIPGMGFGTGHHETTSSILRFMQELSIYPDSVLDFGAGSGILSIAAKYFWPKCKVIGIEIDEAAVNNAQENCKLNGLSPELISIGENPPSGDQYSLVISNLYAEALIEKSKLLVRACKHYMLLSGILEEKADEVKDVFYDLGAKLQREDINNKWCSMEWVI